MMDALRRKAADLDEQRKELAMLLKQTTSEIERASQKARDAAAQLRQMEGNPEGYSRPDLKRAYSVTHEAQMRQFMMQSQLEQLRSRQKSLDSAEELLRELIDAGEEMSEAASGQYGSALVDSGTASEQGMSPTGAESVFRSIELAQHRLSRQLQDETGQTLSDLILRAEVCERLVDMDRNKAKAEISRLKQAASAALKTTRLKVQELRSPALDELGLATALRRYAEVLRTNEKFQVELQITGAERPLPQAVELAVFRVVQEALSNASSHSGGSRAEIRARYEPNAIVVTITDDGHGFDVEAALRQAQTRDQSGLIDMQLRAELVGGTLEITSKPGAGCMVTFAVTA